MTNGMTVLEKAAQYRTLNDARCARAYGQHYAVLALGQTQVWYMKPEYFGNGDLPDPENLGKTHTLLGCIRGTHLEHIFDVLQGHNWSPNGEARTLIIKKGLRHTSMSVGDVVKCGDVTYMVGVIGFKELPKKREAEPKKETGGFEQKPAQTALALPNPVKKVEQAEMPVSPARVKALSLFA